jgi:uncharacterized protein YjbI with pentapeptide repeats
MKKIILITMLISALFAQSDCNKKNWQEYYNSDGRDMSDCQLQGAMLRGARLMGADLTGADLTGANFTGAKLVGIISGDIRGVPDNLPEGWSLVDGTLIK